MPRLEGTDQQLANYRRLSINWAVSMYAIAAFWGTAQLLFPHNSAVYLLAVLAFAYAATSWAAFDSRSRGKTILPVLQLLYFLMWPIGATIYLVARNGWRGILIAVVHGTALTLTLGLTFYITFYSLHYLGLLGPEYYPAR